MRHWSIPASIVILAALAGCTQPVTTPISQEAVTNIPAYFWTFGEGSLLFEYPNGSPSNTLTFSPGTNGTLDVNEAAAPTIRCIINQDSIFASGFSQSSFVGLGPGMYLSALDSEAFDTIHTSAVATTDDGSYQTIVATNAGIYFYDPTVADSFQFGGLDSSDVTALAFVSSSHEIYAATTFGTILYTSAPLNKVTTWSQYASSLVGPVQQLIWLRNDSLFATVKGSNGIYVANTYSGSQWTSLSFLSGSQVTTLGKYSTSNNMYLLAGTSSGQIAAHSLNTGASDAPPVTVASQVYCFASQSSQVFAGTSRGIYEWSGPTSNGWTSSQGLESYLQVTSIATNSSQIIFLSNGTLFSSTIGTLNPTQVYASFSSPIQQVGWNDSSAWVLTTRNYDTARTINAPFTLVPGLPNGYWPVDSGGLVLLRNTLFENDSSWRAGTLVTAGHQFYGITARVLGHLDSLRVTPASGASISYPDVIMVRYAHELSGENLDTIPYWIIYYAKAKGPVMFDNIVPATAGSNQAPTIVRRELE